MKLTLEQKAFYEYGRAVESLKRTIYETRETAIQEFKDPYRLLSTYDRKQLIDAMGQWCGLVTVESVDKEDCVITTRAVNGSLTRTYCDDVNEWPWEIEQE